MRGKTVVITGGTSGIGEVAAEILAKKAARIVLVARDQTRGDATLARLRNSAPGVAHSIYFADLTRLAEMKRVAAQIADQEPRIDVLINNAGALFARRRLTQDGLEFTFALNHMAYFVLTGGLRKRLLASRPARIINTASAAHQGAILDFDDLQSAKNFGAKPTVARNCATSYLRVSSPAGCTARASLQIACIPVSSLHALVTKAVARSRASFGSLSFLLHRPLKVRKQSSILRPRRTWPRPRGNTITIASRPRRRRRHATTDLLCCCGSAARHWPA
jgi:NAD(P)-dependent dehydrogenase (short-subunit alcohol dehydrogenase family)